MQLILVYEQQALGANGRKEMATRAASQDDKKQVGDPGRSRRGNESCLNYLRSPGLSPDSPELLLCFIHNVMDTLISMQMGPG